MTDLSFFSILGMLFFLLAWFFLLVEAYGLIFLRNIYSRMLISALADTVAMMLIFMAILLTQRTIQGAPKLLILLLFLMAMNPVTSHLIARSARRNGVGLSDRPEGE